MYLYLDGNALTGPIPAWLGGLTKLQDLYLRYNRLSGTVSAELGDLPALDYLYLRGNPTLSCPVADYRGWARVNDWDRDGDGYGSDGRENCVETESQRFS